MDGGRLSRFPHLSWLGFGFEAAAGARPLAFHLTTSCHSITVGSVGRHAVRAIQRGRETQWSASERCVTYFPARDDQYEFLVDAVSSRCGFVNFSIPRLHIANYLQSEHSDASPDVGRFLALDDRVLADCMTRLATLTAGSDSSDDGRLDEAARRLVLRLAELSGGGVPDWHHDESTFDRQTLAALVERIDASQVPEAGQADGGVARGINRDPPRVNEATFAVRARARSQPVFSAPKLNAGGGT